MDVVDSRTRSRMMAGIRGADTRPELALRRELHRAGLRYRLHVAGLPGRPDLVFPARRAAVLVHGCFWHRHEGCHWCTTPASNVDFWTRKFSRNVERDMRHLEELSRLGWRVAIVWECALKGAATAATVTAVREWLASDREHFETGLIRGREYPASGQPSG